MPRLDPPWKLRLFAGLARVAAWLLRALGSTWRVRTEGENPLGSGRAVVGALWHGGFLIAAPLFRDRGVALPVSRSRDGERVAMLLRELGYGPLPRGSSTRGGVGALAGLVRAVRSGHTAAVLCDGPRGPARRAKPGPLAIARLAGAELVAAGLAARPALRFGSWDRVILPLPFARVACVFGRPLSVPAEGSRATLERSVAELQRELDRVTERAEQLVGPERSTGYSEGRQEGSSG